MKQFYRKLRTGWGLSLSTLLVAVLPSGVLADEAPLDLASLGMYGAVFPVPKIGADHSQCDPMGGSAPHFTLDIQCRVLCLGKAVGSSGTLSTEFAFSAKNAALHEGDGNLLAPLTVGLALAADRACLAQAAFQCGGLAKVGSADPLSLQSGDWHSSATLGCGVHQARVISPLDPKFPGRLRTSGPTLAAQTILAEKRPELGFLGVVISSPAPVAARKCKYPLTGHLCYGDCVDLNTNAQLLASSSPLGRSEIDVCADPFASFAKREPSLSPATLETYCREFFWRSLKKANGFMPLSCAAVRGDIDCQKLVHSLGLVRLLKR